MILTILEAATAALLIISILLQHRASGLTNSTGGLGGGTYVQRRGPEKFLYQATITLSILFFVLIVLDWYI